MLVTLAKVQTGIKSLDLDYKKTVIDSSVINITDLGNIQRGTNERFIYFRT